MDFSLMPFVFLTAGGMGVLSAVRVHRSSSRKKQERFRLWGAEELVAGEFVMMGDCTTTANKS